MNYKIIAHRLGFQITNHDENSIKCLEDIFSDKEKLDSCDGFEFDIRFTKDNVPVLFHDKNLRNFADRSDRIKDLMYEDFRNVDLLFRSSRKNKNLYNCASLEEILDFFSKNKKKLSKKIIKVETKDSYLSKKNIVELDKILRKHNNIQKNLVHLSFYPNNLNKLKKYQYGNDPLLTDLLCDYKVMCWYAYFIKKYDYVSIRYSNKSNLGILSYLKKKILKKKTKKIKTYFCINLNKKFINMMFKKYEYINLYTINSKTKFTGLDKICKEVKSNVFITTDNPIRINEFISDNERI